jgi:hypothetical protein
MPTIATNGAPQVASGHALAEQRPGEEQDHHGLERRDGRGIGQRRVLDGEEERADVGGERQRSHRPDAEASPGEPTAGRVQHGGVEDRSDPQAVERDAEASERHLGDQHVAQAPEHVRRERGGDPGRSRARRSAARVAPHEGS